MGRLFDEEWLYEPNEVLAEVLDHYKADYPDLMVDEDGHLKVCWAGTMALLCDLVLDGRMQRRDLFLGESAPLGNAFVAILYAMIEAYELDELEAWIHIAHPGTYDEDAETTPLTAADIRTWRLLRATMAAYIEARTRSAASA